jgi:hypothetical protein
VREFTGSKKMYNVVFTQAKPTNILRMGPRKVMR